MLPFSVLIKGHIMGLYLLKGYVETWLTSLAPTIGESECSRKSKTSVRKKILREASLQTILCLRKIVAFWKHKTSFRKRNLCLAKLAEKLFVEGETLQAACDICYMQCCMFN